MDARRIVSRVLEVLMVAILGVMVVLVFGNVVARYGFDAAITWAEEVARFLFAGLPISEPLLQFTKDFTSESILWWCGLEIALEFSPKSLNVS